MTIKNYKENPVIFMMISKDFSLNATEKFPLHQSSLAFKFNATDDEKFP